MDVLMCPGGEARAGGGKGEGRRDRVGPQTKSGGRPGVFVAQAVLPAVTTGKSMSVAATELT